MVQAFRQQGKKLVAEPPLKVSSVEAAIDGTKRLAKTKDGAVAMSVNYDEAADYAEEPKVRAAGKRPSARGHSHNPSRLSGA